MLTREGLATEGAVRRARDRARAEERPAAAVLVDDGTVAADVLADALARAVESVVIDVEAGALDAESVALLPEPLARRHLALPVQTDPSGATLRVAFADPLDAEATDAVGEATGLAVQPLVATVPGVRAGIDREYRAFDTRVIRSAGRARAEQPTPAEPQRADVPSENTQRLQTPGPEGPAGPTTSPMHRLEDEAEVEQRLEALVLALIEAGVITRADYLAALRRLIGHDRGDD